MATVPGGDYSYGGGGSQPVVLPVVVQSNEQGKILDTLFTNTLGNASVTQTTTKDGTVILKGDNGSTVKVFSEQNAGKTVKGILTKNDGAVIATDKTTKVDAGAGANQVVVQGTGPTFLNVGGGNDTVALSTDGVGQVAVNLGTGNDKLVISSQFQGNSIVKDFTKKDQLQILDRTKDGKIEAGKDYVYYKSGKDTILVLFKDGQESTKVTLKNVNTNKVNVSDDGILTLS